MKLITAVSGTSIITFYSMHTSIISNLSLFRCMHDLHWVKFSGIKPSVPHVFCSP
jgi:hypothetical protein